MTKPTVFSCIIVGLLSLVAVRATTAAKHGPISFKVSTALPPEEGVTRRDPSDVIRVGDTYYVWYTKVVKGPGIFQYPSGYSGDVFYATSTDGQKFEEQGIAVGKGGKGAWDEHGVFTPNIMKWQGKFYLFYTGVPLPFDAQTHTAIGVAVADKPEGPWRKAEQNPVLESTADTPEAFDSMRVDDASLIHREGKVWLYYKGRSLVHGKSGPGKTRMGVAVADSPLGPFTRSKANPLHRGHEVLVWPLEGGVMSMATNAGPRQLYFAADGLHFKPRRPLSGGVGAPGIYRVDDFRDADDVPRPTWGISMGRQGRDVYLRRFEIRYPDAE